VPTVNDKLLDVTALEVAYGSKQVVFGVDMYVRSGEIVGLIGHNGAGKTTTIRAVYGMQRALKGTVTFHGKDVTGASCRRNVLAGMAVVLSERMVFGELTVYENLLLGALYVKSADERNRRLDEVYELFPILKERRNQQAGTFSGGQQRMLSLGVALMCGPSLLLLDEPSLGLAPSVVQTLFDTIRELATTRGIGILLLEQNVGQLLRTADRVYAMRSGRIIVEETGEQMRQRDDYWDLF
jgi:branched-chain amino acid transport system ATP-binding protein